MSKDIVIGLDLGTTTCKAIAIDRQGRLQAAASANHPLYTPHPGWVEQSPEDLWKGVVNVMQQIGQKLPAERIAAICISGAMHSIFPVDRSGNPLANASTWADTRAAEETRQLRQQIDLIEVYRKVGCPVQHIYHLPRLAWWVEQSRSLPEPPHYYVGLKDWILYRLTGRWITDIGMASTTGLMNIHTQQWDPDVLSLIHLEQKFLPQIVSPISLENPLTPLAAEMLHATPGIPVIPGSSDGGLANLGAGVARNGEMVVTVGTSGAVRKIVSEPWFDPQARTWCYSLLENVWFAGGAINNGGLAIQWVRERFYPEFVDGEGYAQLMQDAARIAAGAGGVLFLPYFTGERCPHWDPTLHAGLVGLGLEHTRAHVARAVLEGVAYCLADVWEILCSGGDLETTIHVTGSITHNPVWISILADVLGVPVIPFEAADASAVGAGMMGHLALGNIAKLEEIPQLIPAQSLIQPNAENHAVYQSSHRSFQGEYRKIYSA